MDTGMAMVMITAQRNMVMGTVTVPRKNTVTGMGMVLKKKRSTGMVMEEKKTTDMPTVTKTNQS